MSVSNRVIMNTLLNGCMTRACRFVYDTQEDEDVDRRLSRRLQLDGRRHQRLLTCLADYSENFPHGRFSEIQYFRKLPGVKDIEIGPGDPRQVYASISCWYSIAIPHGRTASSSQCFPRMTPTGVEESFALFHMVEPRFQKLQRTDYSPG